MATYKVPHYIYEMNDRNDVKFVLKPLYFNDWNLYKNLIRPMRRSKVDKGGLSTIHITPNGRRIKISEYNGKNG